MSMPNKVKMRPDIITNAHRTGHRAEDYSRDDHPWIRDILDSRILVSGFHEFLRIPVAASGRFCAGEDELIGGRCHTGQAAKGIGYVCTRRNAALVAVLILHLIAIWSSPVRADGAETPNPLPAALTRLNTVPSQAMAPSFANVTGPAEPTAAWRAFCQRMPAECAVDLSEPGSIQLTVELLALLRRVTRQVNRAIVPMTDLAHWNVADRWDYPGDGYGDCEDFQLLKRKRLIEKGLPRRALRMTVVLDQNGDGHAVLMVRTTSGDLVLDNSTSAVLPWRETGYHFVKREGQGGPAWVSLVEPLPRAVVASRGQTRGRMEDGDDKGHTAPHSSGP
jgi:predicted transglutaminase-like cysteine proteinase